MAAHQRVRQIRAESGIPPPPQPARPQQDSEAERNARLSMIQLESLGSSRRDRISSEDFPENRRNLVSWKKLEAARLSNKSGTKENVEFQANEALLKGWNNAWQELEGDGTVEEQFDDINRGQAHRAKIMSDPEFRQEYGEELNLRRHHADDGGRPRGGGRGGRGGGFVGSRSRVVGLKRVAVGIPAAAQHLGGAAQASPFPPPLRERGHSNEARSSTREGSSSRGLPTPSQGGVSSQGPSSSKLSKGPPTPIQNPASPSRPARPLREAGWEFKLADPAIFMEKACANLSLSSNVAPVTKSNTVSSDTPTPSLANPPTTTEVVAQRAHSSFPASSSTITKESRADAATTPSAFHSPIIKVAGAGSAPPTSAPHLAPRKGATTEPDLEQRGAARAPSAPHLAITRVAGVDTAPSTSAPQLTPNKTATREPDLATSRNESWKAGPSEETPAKREPEWPAVAVGRGKDRGSSLIDFGDASNMNRKAASPHKTSGESRAVQTTSSSPRSERSYTGDLLGLHIQPDTGRSLPIQEPRTNYPSRTGSNPSIADLHAQMSSLMPQLQDALEPEMIKSYENIIAELQVKSMGAARTSEAAPDIEPPTEAFGRLSIHDHHPIPTSVSKESPTSRGSRSRSTFDLAGKIEASEGSGSGQSTITNPANVHEAVRGNFREAREQLAKAFEEEAEDFEVDEKIFKTMQPSTSRSAINQVGYLGAQALRPRPAPANTSRGTATARPSMPPHARMNLSGAATTSTSVPTHRSSVGIPRAAESRSQFNNNQARSAPSPAVEAGKVDKNEEEEEDYPLEAILRTTFVPSGPSMLNRGGFYKK